MMRRDRGNFYFSYPFIYSKVHTTNKVEYRPFRKLFLKRTQAGTAFRNLFFPAINTTRLGVSCYPTALLSNKLVQRLSKFQRVTANNSLDSVQFLNPPPPQPNFGLLYAFRNLFFFRKIALHIHMLTCIYTHMHACTHTYIYTRAHLIIPKKNNKQTSFSTRLVVW
jgi:hypothetical protein